MEGGKIEIAYKSYLHCFCGRICDLFLGVIELFEELLIVQFNYHFANEETEMFY